MRRTHRGRGGPRFLPLVPVLLIPALSPTPTGAQDSSLIRSAPVCASCRILVDTVAVLGDVTGPGMVQGQAQIRKLPEGIYLLTSRAGPVAIQVFDDEGAFLTRFGRHGEGPGEYGRPWIAPAGDEDAVYIFDMALSRVTELDLEFEVASTRRLPLRPITVATLGDARFVISGAWPGADRIGFPLHLYDHRTGEVVRSFGAEGEAERVEGRGDGSQERRVSVGRERTVWSAFTNRYRIERWDTAGVMLLAWDRDPDWFPPRRMRWTGNLLTDPPPPELVDIAEDPDGRLWVLATRAAEDWRPPTPIWTTETHPYVPDSEMNQMYDSVIEVFERDGPEARLLVSQAFTGRFLGFAAPAVAYMYKEDEEGNPGYAILRLQIAP